MQEFDAFGNGHKFIGFVCPDMSSHQGITGTAYPDAANFRIIEGDIYLA